MHIGGYTEDGWVHEVLVALARNRGFPAYRQEFKSHSIDVAQKTAKASHHEERLVVDGIERITATLKSGSPVIVSVSRGFQEKAQFHIVVLVGLEEGGGFYYHEPDAQSRNEGEYRFIDIDNFKEHWRKMAVFVHPSR